MNYLKCAYLLLIGAMLYPASIHAQTFGNEWINPSQDYYKVMVGEDGIYRVTYQELQQGGFPVNGVDPRRIRMFFRGQERAIWIEGEADGSFDPGDYIEFYGEKNDAYLDRFLYDEPGNIPNPYRNLYSDQTAYFLTFRNDGSFGKRMDFYSQSSSGQEPVPYYEAEFILETTSLNYGGVYPSYLSYGQYGAKVSHFTAAKGYIGYGVDANAGNRVLNLDLGAKYKPVEGFTPTFQLHVVGLSNGPHRVNIEVGPSEEETRLLRALSFNNYEANNLNERLNNADFTAGSSNFTFVADALDASPNITREITTFGAMTIRFTQEPDLEGNTLRQLTLPNNASNQSRVVLNNPAAGSRIFDLTDPNNMRIIGSEIVNGRLNAVIDGTSAKKTILVSAGEKSVDSIEPVSFSTIPSNIDYLIISHSDLMQPAGEYNDPVQAYADYRASAVGGGYKAYVGDIDELYNQFTYGEYSPLAVRRLIQYLQGQNANVKHLFLVGKSLALNYQYFRNLPGSANWGQKDLVPCMGYPCSDLLFTAKLGEETGEVNTIPTGRVSALNAQHVADYLDKVKEHEQYEFNDLSKKKALFLSGGASTLERRIIKSYSQEFVNQFENSALGGKGDLKAKTTTATVEIFNVSQEVNDGLQILTAFGHSSPDVNDINIGHPFRSDFNYVNRGRYPFVIINGCNFGNAYRRAVSTAERWIIAPHAGAISLIASSDAGYPSKLRFQTKAMINQLYGNPERINQSIGRGIINTHKEFIEVWGEDDKVALAQIQQYVYQGDPAIKLFDQKFPDYKASGGELFIENTDPTQAVTSETERFYVGIPTSNFGVHIEGKLKVAVRRSFNSGIDGEKWYPTQEFDAVAHKDTLYYLIENTQEDRDRSSGINTFEVHLDYGNEIEEANEANNTGSINFVFPNSSIRLLSPTNYSIVAQQPVRLIAQNLDMQPKERGYIFQMDTTDLFNSPYFKEQMVTATYNPSWQPGSLISDNAQDSIVYYWRVKFAEVGELDDPTWEEGSFVYVKESPKGWTQRHFPQFKKNATNNFTPVTTGEQWQFKTDTLQLEVRTEGGQGNFRNGTIRYNDQVILEGGTCSVDAILLMAINHKTGEIYNRMESLNIFSACGVTGTNRPLTRFRSVLGARRPFLKYIYDNALDSGDYVLMVNTRNIPFNFMLAGDYEALRNMGIPEGTMGDIVKPGYPFIALGRVDVPGYVAPVFTADPNNDSIPPRAQEIFHTLPIPIQRRVGQITSPDIGPAKSWGDFKYLFGEKDSPSDQVAVDLLGIRPDGSATVLEQNVPSDGLDLSGYSPDEYPKMRLSTKVSDQREATPQQLRRWQVRYEPLPEGILHYEAETADFSKPLRFGEGEEALLQFRFDNLTEADFPQQIVFQRTLKMPDNSISSQFDTLTALPGLEALEYEVRIPTLGLAGENILTVFANPLSQAEQHYDNNVLERRFQVDPDQTNPVLDVAFDGVRIMDGDIVSPQPTINITLTDENPYYTLADTASLELYISLPNSSELIAIPVEGNPEVEWIEQGDNELRIHYTPSEPLEDGNYQLKVQAKDATGNTAGAQPYQVSFEVINASQITHFYPYPNPFSTNVRFVFTLTGDRIPDEIRIQIMTVSGRVVKEITQEELGPVRIGNNISEYAWDGKDQFGDQLANGTYLYRVITNYEGEAIERRTTANDDLFKKNIGKMYLIR